jgi:RNA-directed DNA polymerase
VRDFWQIDLFHQPIPLSDFYLAYESCRRKKRSTANCIAFEVDYERNLQELYEDVNSARYVPRRSIAFIIHRPVKREVFAADFRDRVIHHLLIDKLNRYFEKSFIYDCYACREGRGTHFAVKRVDHFIRSCSRNYSTDCYILKLDIAGFFMHIDRRLLWSRLERFIDDNYPGFDKEVIKYLARTTALLNPAENCIIKGRRSDWDGLPESKSLFHSPEGCGLPIGNLTSQVFANFYMTPFDHFMKHTLGLRYYGRYVDDLIVVHPDKEFLLSIIPKVASFLSEELGLTLHPDKIYLQHYSKGVKYLGCVIKPHRIYIADRTKGNFYQCIDDYNTLATYRMNAYDRRVLTRQFRSSVNSYLGLLSHYSTYLIRRRELYSHLSSWWINRISPKRHCRKIVLR